MMLHKWARTAFHTQDTQRLANNFLLLLQVAKYAQYHLPRSSDKSKNEVILVESCPELSLLP